MLAVRCVIRVHYLKIFKKNSVRFLISAALQILEQWRTPMAAMLPRGYSSEATPPRALTMLTEDELAMKETGKKLHIHSYWIT